MGEVPVLGGSRGSGSPGLGSFLWFDDGEAANLVLGPFGRGVDELLAGVLGCLNVSGNDVAEVEGQPKPGNEEVYLEKHGASRGPQGQTGEVVPLVELTGSDLERQRGDEKTWMAAEGQTSREDGGGSGQR